MNRMFTWNQVLMIPRIRRSLIHDINRVLRQLGPLAPQTNIQHFRTVIATIVFRYKDLQACDVRELSPVDRVLYNTLCVQINCRLGSATRGDNGSGVGVGADAFGMVQGLDSLEVASSAEIEVLAVLEELDHFGGVLIWGCPDQDRV